MQSKDFKIVLESENKKITITIKEQDLDKLARVIYEICLDNKIDATIE